MIKYITLQMGYAENRSVGTLLFLANCPKENKEEAIKDLAADLFEKCYDDARNYIKPPIQKQDFAMWLYRLAFRDADEWGEETRRWWPWNTMEDLLSQATKDEVVTITESAEWLLANSVDPESITREEVKTYAIAANVLKWKLL